MQVLDILLQTVLELLQVSIWLLLLVQGRGATASVYIKDGVVGTATITSGGSGYVVGDVVGFTTLGVNSVGRDARLTIVSIGMTSELVVNDVQGDFTVGAAKTIMLTNACRKYK